MISGGPLIINHRVVIMKTTLRHQILTCVRNIFPVLLWKAVMSSHDLLGKVHVFTLVRKRGVARQPVQSRIKKMYNSFYLLQSSPPPPKRALAEMCRLAPQCVQLTQLQLIVIFRTSLVLWSLLCQTCFQGHQWEQEKKGSWSAVGHQPRRRQSSEHYLT